jgi:hypothetical protein
MAGGPPKNKDFQVEINNFRTYNSKDNPVTMKDDELPVLLNFMPIGTSLYSMPGYVIPDTGDIATTGAKTLDGTTIIRMYDANLDGTIYKIVACSDGSLYQFDTSTTPWTRTTIAGIGTFTGSSAGPYFEQWEYTKLLIIDPKGYWSYAHGGSITPLGGTTNARRGGESIAVWKNQIFFGGSATSADGDTRRTIFYSVAGSYTNFTDPNTSLPQAQTDNYASLRNKINALVATQDYLYVIGDHGTHVMSGVQMLSSGSYAFTLTNSLPGIGTVFPESVQAYGDTIFMLSSTGVHAISAGSHELLSSYLDGIFPSIDLTFYPVSFIAEIYNKTVFCLLVQVISPLDAIKQKWFLCYYEGRWFPVFMGVVGGGSPLDFNFAGQRQSATDATCFAAYDNQIVQLFTGSIQLTKKIRTKLYNLGDSIHDKQVLRIGVILANTQAFITPFSASVRCYAKIVSASPIVSFAPNTVEWSNRYSAVLPWEASIGGTIVPTTEYPADSPPFTWNKIVGGSEQTLTWFTIGGEAYGMTQCDGRGKRIAIDYEESDSSGPVYVLAGFIVEGQIGADW